MNSMRNKVNLALMAKDFLKWGGGIDFLLNSVNALLQGGKTNELFVSILIPEITLKGKIVNLLYPYKKIVEDISSFRRPHFFRANMIAKEILLDSLDYNRSNMDVVNYRDDQHGLMQCLERINADIVFPFSSSPGPKFPHSWLGYVPDLQHKYLPNLFTKAECKRRDRIFLNLLKDGKAVIVNSDAVKSDLERYYPDFGCKIIQLPFAPIPLNCWFEDHPANYTIKYNLPEHYFIISNQFWVHKSHITAFEALSTLRTLSPPLDVHIVCTGDTRDYRFPKYFNWLKARIHELDLTQYIHFTGYIPKRDQIQILRGAIGLLQPTLFEGGPGGGAVYDAVAMGVPAIVSDIPVNKEIKDENVFFFHAGSSSDLEEKMMKMSNEDIQRPSKEKLMEKGYQRAEKLEKTLLEAIEYVLSS